VSCLLLISHIFWVILTIGDAARGIALPTTMSRREQGIVCAVSVKRRIWIRIARGGKKCWACCEVVFEIGWSTNNARVGT
jgi:hypothetical protein